MLKKIIAFFLRKRIVLRLIEDGRTPNYIVILGTVKCIISGKVPDWFDAGDEDN